VETLLSNGAEVDCKEPQSGWQLGGILWEFMRDIDIYIIFILLRYSETQKTCNLLQCFLHQKHIESLGLPDPFPPVNDRWSGDILSLSAFFQQRSPIW
jgi:hypothetical protein